MKVTVSTEKNRTASRNEEKPLRLQMDLQPRNVVLATMTAVGVGIGFLFLYRIYMIIFLLFVAFSVATALKPVAIWCRKRKIPIVVGVFGVYLTALLILVGFLWFTGPSIVEQIQLLMADLPQYYQDIRTYLNESSSRILNGLATVLPAEPLASMQTISTTTTTDSPDSLTWLGNFVLNFGRTSFLAIAIFLLAYYWLIEGETTVRRLLMRTALEKRDEYRKMIAEIEDKIGAYFRGQLLLCLIIGLLSLIAFWIIGVPNAITLAIISGITEAIPMIGPTIGAVPAILTTLTIAPEKSLWVVIALVLIQGAENNFLVPKIMDRSVGVHPLVTIFAIAAFGLLFGIVGAILAIPLAAILQILGRRLLYNFFVLEKDLGETPFAESNKRNRYSVLRLEVEELVQDVRKQSRQRDELDANDDEAEEAEDMIETVAAKLQSFLLKREEAA